MNLNAKEINGEELFMTTEAQATLSELMCDAKNMGLEALSLVLTINTHLFGETYIDEGLPKAELNCCRDVMESHIKDLQGLNRILEQIIAMLGCNR